MINSLHQLFSTPIYEYQGAKQEIFLVQDEIKKIFPKILENDKFENQLGWNDGVQTNIKDRFNTIEHYNLSCLFGYIEKHIKNYLSLVNFRNHKDIFMAHSWANITEIGQGQSSHQHEDSVISGSYYYQTTGEDGDFVFENPNPYTSLELFPFSNSIDNYVNVKPSIGKIILFPGWLKHKVNINQTNSTRISFSFNYLYDNSKKGHRGYK